MTPKTKIQMTPQGLLIPREVLGDWQDVPLELMREEQRIIIRPKSVMTTSRAEVRQMLREAGVLYEVESPIAPNISEVERARLAEKLAQAAPLSELIIAEREDRL